MGKVVGIDLGTSNSSIAIRELETRVLKSAEGELYTPSCVCVDADNSLNAENLQSVVGIKAKNFMRQKPQSTIIHAKRLMGKSWHDPEVQKIIAEKRYSYIITPLSSGTQNSVAIQIPRKDGAAALELTPEKISSLILQKLKQDAEKELTAEVIQGVITVPAYFNDKQKNATLVAAQTAGLKVLRLLPEPTAAAISFGIDEGQADLAETIMVFDFGGGTLDISVLTIGGKNIVEQAKGGDMWLGGADLDHMMLEMILKKVYQSDPTITSSLHKLPKEQYQSAIYEILHHAEATKIKLSETERVSVQIVNLFDDEDGLPVNVDIEITRKEFETLIAPLIKRAGELAENLLLSANLSNEDIDRLLLVGGSSKIPLVKETLSQIFGESKILIHPRPILAIAEGAAILAHRLRGETATETELAAQDAASGRGSNLGEVLYTTAHDYYLESFSIDNAEKNLHLLIPKNTTLPTSAKVVVELKKGTSQKLAHFTFVNKVHENYENIGDLWLSFDLESREEETDSSEDKGVKIELHITINEDNLFHVQATLLNDSSISVAKNLSRGMVDEALFLQLQQGLQQLATIDNYYLGLDFEERLIHIVKDINKIIDPYSNNIDAKYEERSKKQIELAMKCIANNEALFTNLWHIDATINNYEYYLYRNKIYNEDARQNVKKLKEVHKKFAAKITSGDYEEVLKLRDDAIDEIKALVPEDCKQEHTYEVINDMAERIGRKDLLDEITELDKIRAHASNDKERDQIDDRVKDILNEIVSTNNKTPHIIETGHRISQ
ncbi:MAG: Hsp70 family protein [Oligoflexia bacterium]|nr:Hsp70 family protein [Oligoflexia bacterium]